MSAAENKGTLSTIIWICGVHFTMNLAYMTASIAFAMNTHGRLSTLEATQGNQTQILYVNQSEFDTTVRRILENNYGPPTQPSVPSRD